MIESGRRRGMGRVNIEFASLTCVVESASEGANRADLTARGNHCPASLASTPGVWFHGPKSFVEKTFAKDYNSSLAAVHGPIRSTQACPIPKLPSGSCPERRAQLFYSIPLPSGDYVQRF
jgi:hypothetical protein